MPALRGAGPQGPRPTPRAHDHAGRRGLEATRRELPPLSASFFPLGIRRWALITPASAHASSRKRWIQAVWSGQVATILPELEQRSTALGSPPSECVDSDPRKLIFEALRYLKNNADRMRYDHYRRQGLPIMTSAVESVIKQINRRVKGSEKFWSEPGAEAILQLRADYLSETETMSRFWLAREARAGSGRPYRRVA